MDQINLRSDERTRLLEAAAPLLKAFPDDVWLVHQIIPLDNGKIDKPPAPGFRSNDPSSWLSLADAIDEMLRYPSDTAGIGFAIVEGLITFDFDNCIDADGTVAPEIAALVERLDSFSYRTVSGRGIRVVCRNKAADGVLPGKYIRRSEGGHRAEIFVGPCHFFNTFSVTGANGKQIASRTNMTRTLLDEWLGTGGGGGASGSGADGNYGEFGHTSDLGKKARDQDALFDALKAIPHDEDIDRDLWVKIAGAMYAGTEGAVPGREAFIAWSETWHRHDEAPEEHTQAAEDLWHSFLTSPPRAVGAGTVFKLAEQQGWTWPEEKLELDQEEPEVETPDIEVMPPRLSEAALARRFAKRHRKQLRYVAKWGKWLWWSGAVWQEDETNEVLREARLFLQEAAVECVKASQARSLVKVSTALAMLRYAGAELAATAHQWDADLWLLNTPGGVVDLRTGQLRPHRAADYMTKITVVTPDRGCPCLRWLKFLDEIMAKDTGLIGYLQRECGYSLTGDVSEEVLCFGHGTGGNGKSKYIELRVWLMGGYAIDAPMETFTSSKNDNHPTELARLQGARLVVSSETEEGRHWAENRIKMLTGNKQVTGRFMRQDFFTFDRQFKLFIIGNHKPRLHNVDEAVKRRLHLIPFIVKILAAKQDKKLGKKLQAEGSGILAWMIEGCLAWQQQGLAPPKAVVAATKDYLDTEDTLGNWLEECCETGDGLSESTKELHDSYTQWMRRAGEPPQPQKQFVQALTDRGFNKQPWSNHKKPKAIDGLRLAEEAAETSENDDL